MEPTNNPVPKHIGIIMDGNRRFAKRLMLKPWKGHEWGADKVEKLMDWCHELGVEEVTLYAFSLQNFDRPKDEFAQLMRIFEETAIRVLEDARVARYDMRINFIGRMSLFPNKLQRLMEEIMEQTKDHKAHILNIAIGYGGREEVLEATYKIAQKVKHGELRAKDINEDVFEKELYNQSPPDLIIRTGGENRTSNFLIWQSAYSEWMFYEKKYWPEFEKEDLKACIEEYKNRHRRFGK